MHDPNSSPRQSEPDLLHMLRRVIALSGASPRTFYLGLGLRGLERALALTPFLIGYAWFRDAIAGGALTVPPASIGALALALLLALAAQCLCAYAGQLCCFLGAYRLMGGYREHVLATVQRLPLHTLRQQRAGQLAEVLSADIKNVESIFTHVTADLVTAFAVPLLGMAALAWLDWRLATRLLLALPLSLWLLNGARALFLRAGRRKQEQFREASGLLVEYITGIVTLRLFNQFGPWLARLDRHFERMRQSSFDAEAWGAGPVQLYRLCLEFGLVALLLSGGYLAGAGALPTLHWFLFLVIAYKLLDPLLDAAVYLTVLRMAAQSEARIQAVLEQPPLPQAAPDHAAPLALPARYDIAFEAVDFAYQDAQPASASRWHLQALSFQVPERSFTAIVGPSGAGKSSLAHLIARFFDPQQGRILLGGVDLRQLDSAALYQRIGMVFQDVQLFDGSLLDNVRIGRSDASDEAVIEACRQAYCEEFAQALPEGYHTRIGEGGQRLSGGERQRLSIARALLRDAPILLLDEATASVDAEAQYQIQQALSRLAQGRTVIMIAHRLNTIRHADQILVLDQGRLVESGCHDALLAKQGLYARLWHGQHGEEIDAEVEDAP
ncbi:ABC transporter ATP-binding protein [Cupriavidus sp. CuC1]|uniref:ABC transporter ATP-binding protein n=1 Tax=Cupriavidus sp. CuC1 TaxID=3373131 RepID=UPI0037D098EE